MTPEERSALAKKASDAAPFLLELRSLRARQDEIFVP
jgi:hypothetical protein